MRQDQILATYLIETPDSLEHAAQVLAGEQSTGTFVQVPGETDEWNLRHIKNCVVWQGLIIYIQTD